LGVRAVITVETALKPIMEMRSRLPPGVWVAAAWKAAARVQTAVEVREGRFAVRGRIS
jgi:hypothetical protein